ncbi:MAG: 1-acyl-sn-glycerol-3-phosphate acyltransferase [Treponema sp.]|nr:1-acyl-sn-glycerol-3-phosphate acyltransferase [Treponema sp.]
MTNFITMACLVQTVIFDAVANIFAYPLSKKLCLKISRHISKKDAPRVFAVMNTYKHFNFMGYKDLKDELPPQFIIMSNHQSLLDIPVYMNFFRDKSVRFVAKDSLSRHIPLVSEMLRAEEHCMVPRRGSPTVAMRTIDAFAKRVVERNQIPVIVPEGTRSKDGSLGNFYAAGFRRLSDGCRLPVAVCALDGGWQINNLKTIFKNIHHGSYRVKVLKIYDAPATKEEQVKILEEGKELIQKQLDEWRSE